MQSNCSQAQRDEAIAWLLRLRDAPNDLAQRQAFEAWIAADPAHREAYAQVERQWQWLEPFREQSFPARDAALRYRKPRQPSTVRRVAAWATAASVLLAVGWLLFSPRGWYGWPVQYRTAVSERRTVDLADGSTLELNSDSAVSVRFNRFGRTVELMRGEAFFIVRHEADRPFTVQTEHALIRDIGTAFDVYRREGMVSVAVVEGVVELEGRGERRRLTAGQQLAYRSDGRFIATAQPDIAAAIAWRQGLLVFRGRRLAEVVDEISRYHAVGIRVPDPKLADLKLNGSFRTDQLDALLNAIATLLPVKVRRLGEHDIVIEAVGKA